MRSELAEMKANLDHLHHECLAVKSELKFRALRRALKANFNPDQPRDEEGQWTDGGGDNATEDTRSSANQVGAIFADFESLPMAARLEALLGDSSSDAILQPAAATITYSTARTGIQKIDDTTDKLSKILVKTMDTMDIIPESTPSVYGMAVHRSFATAIKALDLPGIGRDGVEQTFSLTDAIHYGAEGSVRTDVALRNDDGEVVAIYDLKTGGARLSSGRAEELRAKTKSGPNVPVIELHFYRGSRLKHESFSQGAPFDPATLRRHSHVRKYVGCRTYRLYR